MVKRDGAPVSKLESVFQLLENIVKTDRDLSVKDFFKVDDIEVSLLKGQRFKRTAFSTLASGSRYSVIRSDYLVGITHLSYAPSIGLPRPMDVGAGKVYIVKDEAGGAGSTTITVRSAGEETIDGSSSSTITSNYGSKEYYTDGANWFTK